MKKFVHHAKPKFAQVTRSVWQYEVQHSQFQEGQVSVAVESPVFALLHHVVLEDSGGLGVIPIKAIENSLDICRSGFTLVEGDHLVGDLNWGGGLRERVVVRPFWWDF